MSRIGILELSILVMVAAGFLIRRFGRLGKEAEGLVTDLVMDLALPCNIFMSFVGSDLEEGTRDFLAVMLISLGVQLLSLVYGKLAFPKESADRRCNLAYAMICSNAGFLGSAITEGVLGTEGLMLTSVYLIPQRIMMWTEGIALYAGHGKRRGVIKKVLTHPCMISCFLGLAVMILKVPVPELIQTPLDQLGRCSTPLTMVLIGMTLSEIDLRTLADRTIVRFTVHRLVGMPLVVYLICRLLPVSPLVTGVSVLLAAMPAGATTGMLASRYGRDPVFASRLIVFTTLCSLPALFLWTLVLKL